MKIHDLIFLMIYILLEIDTISQKCKYRTLAHRHFKVFIKPELGKLRVRKQRYCLHPSCHTMAEGRQFDYSFGIKVHSLKTNPLVVYLSAITHFDLCKLQTNNVQLI